MKNLKVEFASLNNHFKKIEMFTFAFYPGFPPYEKHGNHRKSYMVINENIKVTENSIEVYGNMQVIKRPYYSMIPCKSYTVP